MNADTQAAIGHAVSQLQFISRQEQREKTLASDEFVAFGEDVWRTSELTWLDRRGKPIRGNLTICVPAASSHIVESKSLKLFLVELAMVQFDTKADVASLIQNSLSNHLGTSCTVQVDTTAVGFEFEQTFITDSHRLDYIPLGSSTFEVNRDLLAPRRSAVRASGRYHTDLFRSKCPMSGNPDYATIVLTFEDAWVSAESLLSYLLSYRTHPIFHESAVERIFEDVTVVCRPRELSVYGSFARRGGIDICPYRSSKEEPAPNWRSDLA